MNKIDLKLKKLSNNDIRASTGLEATSSPTNPHNPFGTFCEDVKKQKYTFQPINPWDHSLDLSSIQLPSTQQIEIKPIYDTSTAFSFDMPISYKVSREVPTFKEEQKVIKKNLNLDAKLYFKTYLNDAYGDSPVIKVIMDDLEPFYLVKVIPYDNSNNFVVTALKHEYKFVDHGLGRFSKGFVINKKFLYFEPLKKLRYKDILKPKNEEEGEVDVFEK